MPYQTSYLRLEGIRGFNNPVEFSFGEGVTLIYGPNGSGKSSILQAVEWCITGSMPYMRGGDFAREDAIVNLFNPRRRASVELQLKGIKSALTLVRTRKMGSSTSRGRQTLKLQAQDKVFEDEEAEEELERRLKISLEDFPRSKYLHQETIREALSTTPEERSQAIERLLGTFEIREFAKSLDMDRQVSAAIKRLEFSIEALKRDKIQLILNLKMNLEKSRKALLDRGFVKEELTLGSAVEELHHLRERINQIREQIGVEPVTYPPTQLNVQAIMEADRELLEELSVLDRMRMGFLQRAQNRRLNIQDLSERYSSTISHFEDLKSIDVNALKARIVEIDVELGKFNKEITGLQQKLSAFPSKRASYEDLKQRYTEEQKSLNMLLSRFGDEKTIQRNISSLDEELEGCVAELDKLSECQHLIKLAADYLQRSKASICPVCSQSIDNSKLVEELRSKISVDIAHNIEELHEKEKKIKQRRKELEEALQKKQKIFGILEDLGKRLSSITESLIAIIGKKPEEVDLDSLAEGWEEEIRGLQTRENQLRIERGEIEGTIERRGRLFSELDILQRRLQAETNSSSVGTALLEEVENVLSEIGMEIERYTKTLEIDESRKRSIRLSDILNYLKDEESVGAAEKELPVLSKQIEDLEARKTSLQLLSGSLTSIRKLAAEYEKEASLAKLKRIEEEINRYCSAMMGHPYFNRLKLEIEKEEPLIYSIRAVSDSEATYIPTRFSTSQLNIAALAIFMSNSSLLSGDLPLMILDDPTQSMDTEHKEALAKLISQLASNYQIILATEDDEMRKYIERYCSKLRIYELGRWNPSGPEIKAPS
ncbi:MAG: SMC family ATPase [Candidatus Bathyarchaeia archaeon]